MQERIVDPPEEFAEYTAQVLFEAGKDVSCPSAALPGGRSVLPVLEGIHRLPDEILGKYRFYLVDERWERDHNGEMLEEELFYGLLEEGRISRDNLRFPDVSRPVERVAREYGEDLPDFSVVFLGVGEDGHVASLFPGHPLLHAEGKTAYLTDSPKPPPTRLTLTFGALSRAARQVLIFWGEGKSEAYRRFEGTDDWESIPASYFKGMDTTLVLRDGRIGR
jgi:6-phosphogluconolactonase